MSNNISGKGLVIVLLFCFAVACNNKPRQNLPLDKDTMIFHRELVKQNIQEHSISQPLPDMIDSSYLRIKEVQGKIRVTFLNDTLLTTQIKDVDDFFKIHLNQIRTSEIILVNIYGKKLAFFTAIFKKYNFMKFLTSKEPTE